MAEKTQAIQGLDSSDRAIADEVQNAVGEKKPLTFKRIITNEYVLHLLSMATFLFVWHQAATQRGFQRGAVHPVAGSGAVPCADERHPGRAHDLGAHLGEHAAHPHRVCSGLARRHPARAVHGA